MQNPYNETEDAKKSNHSHSHSTLIVRPRLNAILAQAVKKPLTIVCAGMGCGKTRAVYDFTQECGLPVAWIQITATDNIGPRLWELFVHAVERTNKRLAGEYKKLGFPDTENKLNLYLNTQNSITNGAACMFVMDDFHLLKDAAVLKFMEVSINNLPKNVSIILISRELPQINISSLMARDNIYLINEAELNFNANEISQYLLEQGLVAEIANLKKIYNDTNGWAFMVNIIMRMLKKSPGYMGYVNDAIKYDILQLIEIEVWNTISDKLKRFLLRLSLINHYSAGLMDILRDGDESLIAELKTQNAFIRFNNHMASWHIHPSLLDFLHTRQNILSDKEIFETYKTTADWCIKNNFIVDALFYYEKINDYETIVAILLERQQQFLKDNAQQLFDIFTRAPGDVFDRVDFSAALYIQVVYYSGDRMKASELAERYEAKYRMMPESDAFRNRMLGAIYYCRGYLRLLMSTFDDRYDFDKYFAGQYHYLKGNSINPPQCWYEHPVGMWTNMAGVSRAGAPQEYTDAISRSTQYLQKALNGFTAGIDDLCRGELLFYQGNINDSKTHFGKALEKAMEYGQRLIIHRSMFYIMRTAVFQGDYATAEWALKKMDEQCVLDERAICVINCEISIAWFYYTLSRPEWIPSWLKENFAPHTHANSLENFGNQIKARYCYLTKNYAALLSYIEEQKQRETILFGRIELLAMEACAHYKMDNKIKAFDILQEAYETAAPNNIIMPFIELGKDMRVLTCAAEKAPGCKIPQIWLKNIKQKASAYSRNQSLIVSDYIKKNELGGRIALSLRENSVLHEMYGGLSNAEIAVKLNLSINTVKMHIGNIYSKLGARNKADIFRIAAEHNLL